MLAGTDEIHKIVTFRRFIYLIYVFNMAAYRDMTVPYTEEELVDLRQLFRSLPTFKDEAILPSDIPALIIGMRYERTPEQVQAYGKYWEETYGKVTMDDFMNTVKALYKTSLYAREHVVKADADGDGLISATEFVTILELLKSHDPSLAGKTFEDFITEADTNRDGKVDIEECTKWIEKCTGQ